MAITFEKTPLEWQNPGTEPSTDLKENGFSAGYRPAASTFNYQINNTSECLTELQTKLSDLDQDAIKGIKGNGTTINPSSTGVINITPNNIGAAASTHYHNASQITSGVLPIERGGTGATTLEEARGVLSGGTILYSNESGTTDTTITLSDDISNYKYVEVYYKKNSYKHTLKTSLENYEPGVLPENFPEGIYGNVIMPDCIGVVKTIVKNDSETNICTVYDTCETETVKQPHNDGRYNYVYDYLRTKTYRATASFTGNTFSRNNGYWYCSASKNRSCNYTPYSDGTYRNPSASTSEYSNIGWDDGTCAPEIYAIVGYK